MHDLVRQNHVITNFKLENALQNTEETMAQIKD